MEEGGSFTREALLQAEARLAAKRAARAEAREIRMKELERQQKEIYQVQKKYYGLDTKFGDIEQWMEDSERYSRRARRNTSASDEDERMSVGSRGSLRANGFDEGYYGSSQSRKSSRSSRNSDETRTKKMSSRRDNMGTYYTDAVVYGGGLSSKPHLSSQNGTRPSDYSCYLSSGSRASSRASSARASPVLPNEDESASYLGGASNLGLRNGLPSDLSSVVSGTTASFLRGGVYRDRVHGKLDDVSIPPYIEERPEKDFIEKGNRSVSSLSATTLASLGGTSSRRGSGDTSISVDTEASLREIKDIHELKDQILEVESKYMQELKGMKDSLAEVEEKYKKAMVSNAQLDNDKATLMYQVDILKDALMEAEEQLAETRREYEEKCKENEKQKHSSSILQFQLNEVKETLKQRDELLTKHGIAVGSVVVTNGEASVNMNEIEVPEEVVPTSSQDVSHAQQEMNTEQLGRAEELEMKSENVESMQNTEHEEHISGTQKLEVFQDNAEREEVHAIERAEANKTMNDIEQSTEEIKHDDMELIKNNALQISGITSSESSNQITEQQHDDGSVGLMLDSMIETDDAQKMMHLQEKEEQQEVKVTESEDEKVLNEAGDIVTIVDVTPNSCQPVLLCNNSADDVEQLETNKLLNNEFTALSPEVSMSHHIGEEHTRYSSDSQIASNLDKIPDKVDNVVQGVDVSETVHQSLSTLPGEELRLDHREGHNDVLETRGNDWLNETKQEGSTRKLSLDEQGGSKLLLSNVDTADHLEMGRGASQNSSGNINDHTEMDEGKNAEAAIGVKHPSLSPEDDAFVRDDLGEAVLVDESEEQEHFRRNESLTKDTVTDLDFTSAHNVIPETHREAEECTKLNSVNYKEDLKTTVEGCDNFLSSEDDRYLTDASKYKEDKDHLMKNKISPIVVEQMNGEDKKYDITFGSDLNCVGTTETDQSDKEASHMLVKLPEISTGHIIIDKISDMEGEQQNGAIGQVSGVLKEDSTEENVEVEQNKLIELVETSDNSVTSEKEKTEISHLISEDDIEIACQTFLHSEDDSGTDIIQQVSERNVTDDSDTVEGSISECKLQDECEIEIKSDQDLSLNCSDEGESVSKENEQNTNNQDEDLACNITQPVLSAGNVTKTLDNIEERHQVNEEKGSLQQSSEQELLEKSNNTVDTLFQGNNFVFSDTDVEIDGSESHIGKCQTAGESKGPICSIDNIAVLNTDKDMHKLEGHRASTDQDAEEVIVIQQEKLEHPAEVQNVKAHAVVQTLQEEEEVQELNEAVSETAGALHEPQSDMNELLDTHLEVKEELPYVHPETVLEPSDAFLEVEKKAGTSPENKKQPGEVQSERDECKLEHTEKLEKQLDKHLEHDKEVSGMPLEKDPVCVIVVEGPVEIETSGVGESFEGDPSYLGQLEAYQRGGDLVAEEKQKELIERESETAGEYVGKDREEEESAELETAEITVESGTEDQVVEKDSEGKEKSIEDAAGLVDTKEAVTNGQEQATEKAEPARVDEQVVVASKGDEVVKDSATPESEKQQSNEDDALAKGSKKGKGKSKEECIMSYVRLQKVADDRESLLQQIVKLKAQLEERQKVNKMKNAISEEEVLENGTDVHLTELQRDSNRQICELKFKLAKSEQEITALEQNVIRLEGQVTRYKSATENSEKVEDELKSEKRKLQRELRSALDKIEELEVSNSHLVKRLEKMKANRSALLSQQ
ncbi:cingulin-like [Protopterus annectens]|uniref:cingulin-like n=1 Tax=Protopterus annectens TaxID=7888 RepID=UPI001CFA7399|nr:cingulin-like [Protopterus annectens]